MKNRVQTSLLALVAISAGLIVLAGTFLQIPVLLSLRGLLTRWAMILGAFALWVGVANLFTVHWKRAASGQKGGFYSAVLVLGMIATVMVVGYFGPTAPAALWIFNAIQIPIESSLMAVLAILLVVAAVRLLGRRPNLFSLIFLGTLLLVLVGSASLPGIDLPLLQTTREWIASVPATAGARGILLGVALGTIATGLRLLIGADRPYGG